jgi:hypothetical protein
VIFIFVVERFRLAFNAYIGNINKMDGDMKITIKSERDMRFAIKDPKSWSTMRLIQTALGCAAVLSVLSFVYVLLPSR